MDLDAARRGLVEELWDKSALRTDGVAAAIEAVAREVFVPEMPLDKVYTDTPWVTRRDESGPTSSASQPAIVALMLELLEVHPGDRVLEVGAGTGYNAALLAVLAGSEGRVVTVDLQPDVATEAREHLDAAGYGWVGVIAGDGAAGYAPGAPYDRLIATASVWETPAAWIQQLREGGRIVMPLRLNGTQVVMALERRGVSLVGIEAVPGGFMQLRGAAGHSFTAEVTDGVHATSDAPLAADLLEMLRETWDAGEAVEFELPAESFETFDFFTYLSLQGAPIVSAVRYPRGDRPGGSWLLLAPSSRSVLRFQTHQPQLIELLGERDALAFAQAALLRWQLEGEPASWTLHARIEPLPVRGSHGELPAPMAGRYRYQRGAHSYELWYAPAEAPALDA